MYPMPTWFYIESEFHGLTKYFSKTSPYINNDCFDAAKLKT